MSEDDIADRCQKAVDSRREGAMATGGAKWVAAVDEFIASLRARHALALSKGSDV